MTPQELEAVARAIQQEYLGTPEDFSTHAANIDYESNREMYERMAKAAHDMLASLGKFTK